MNRVRAFTLLCLFGLWVVFSPASAQTSPWKSETKPPLPVGTFQPRLDVTTLIGDHHPTWSGLSGKVVVFDFWATWCGPCIASFPGLNSLKAQSAGKPVEFLSVSYETRGQVEPVLRKHPLQTTVCLDNDFKTFKAFNSWGIPSVFVFDRKGSLAAGEASLRAMREQAVKEEKQH